MGLCRPKIKKLNPLCRPKITMQRVLFVFLVDSGYSMYKF